MTISHTAHLPAPPEHVFGYLYSVDWFAQWYPGLKESFLVGGDGLGRVHTARGTSGAIEMLVDFRIVAFAPPHGLAWSMENARHGKKGKGKHTPSGTADMALIAQLLPEGGGTSATMAVTEPGAVPDLRTGEPLKDLLGGAVSQWVTGRTMQKAVTGSLENLARIVGG